MSYDHWKTTEPESGYDPPVDVDAIYERMLGEYEERFKTLREAALAVKAERDRYEAALRKIAGWKGYATFEGELANDYEEGANDMLVTLRQVAEEALS